MRKYTVHEEGANAPWAHIKTGKLISNKVFNDEQLAVAKEKRMENSIYQIGDAGYHVSCMIMSDIFEQSKGRCLSSYYVRADEKPTKKKKVILITPYNEEFELGTAVDWVDALENVSFFAVQRFKDTLTKDFWEAGNRTFFNDAEPELIRVCENKLQRVDGVSFRKIFSSPGTNEEPDRFVMIVHE